jgi:hypothetical protein
VEERRSNSIRVDSPFADFMMSGSDCDGSRSRTRERVSNCWVTLKKTFWEGGFFFGELRNRLLRNSKKKRFYCPPHLPGRAKTQIISRSLGASFGESVRSMSADVMIGVL